MCGTPHTNQNRRTPGSDRRVRPTSNPCCIHRNKQKIDDLQPVKIKEQEVMEHVKVLKQEKYQERKQACQEKILEACLYQKMASHP